MTHTLAQHLLIVEIALVVIAALLFADGNKRGDGFSAGCVEVLLALVFVALAIVLFIAFAIFAAVHG